MDSKPKEESKLREGRSEPLDAKISWPTFTFEFVKERTVLIDMYSGDFKVHIVRKSDWEHGTNLFGLHITCTPCSPCIDTKQELPVLKFKVAPKSIMRTTTYGQTLVKIVDATLCDGGGSYQVTAYTEILEKESPEKIQDRQLAALIKVVQNTLQEMEQTRENLRDTKERLKETEKEIQACIVHGANVNDFDVLEKLLQRRRAQLMDLDRLVKDEEKYQKQHQDAVTKLARYKQQHKTEESQEEKMILLEKKMSPLEEHYAHHYADTKVPMPKGPLTPLEEHYLAF